MRVEGGQESAVGGREVVKPGSAVVGHVNKSATDNDGDCQFGACRTEAQETIIKYHPCLDEVLDDTSRVGPCFPQLAKVCPRSVCRNHGDQVPATR